MRKVEEMHLSGVLLLSLQTHRDERGDLTEAYSAERYKRYGINEVFVQDNLTHSKQGVLRGLHFQHKRPQGKLLTVLSGSIYDVVVDINPKSKTFMQHIGLELDGDRLQQLWVPPGYAHGFYVLSAFATVLYKCTQAYDADDQHGIIWDDPQLNIAWPTSTPLLSQNDQNWLTVERWLESVR